MHHCTAAEPTRKFGTRTTRATRATRRLANQEDSATVTPSSVPVPVSPPARRLNLNLNLRLTPTRPDPTTTDQYERLEFPRERVVEMALGWGHLVVAVSSAKTSAFVTGTSTTNIHRHD